MTAAETSINDRWVIENVRGLHSSYK